MLNEGGETQTRCRLPWCLLPASRQSCETLNNISVAISIRHDAGYRRLRVFICLMRSYHFLLSVLSMLHFGGHPILSHKIRDEVRRDRDSPSPYLCGAIVFISGSTCQKLKAPSNAVSVELISVNRRCQATPKHKSMLILRWISVLNLHANQN